MKKIFKISFLILCILTLNILTGCTKKYTVTFITNSDTVIENQTVEKGEKATEPINPIKEGYIFDGWYLDNEKWSFIGYSVTDNIELVAKWNIITYKITYDLNGGRLLESNPKTYTVEDEITLNNPTKVGYTFIGWTSEDILEPQLNVTIKNEINDKYFVANYEKNEYTEYTSKTYDWITPQTDSLKLTQDYKGKDFIKDGIGEVTPVRYVDGDTTVFKTSSGESFTVRYNGINTPESTYRIEPWGHAASKYNKQLYADALKAGAKIVLQTEDMKTRLDSTGQRFLAWVWLVYPNGDSKLVNLEMAELGYAHVKSASGTQYESYFTQAIFDISLKKLRIYGEKDPAYDYSNEAKAMSIKEIRDIYGTKEAINKNSSEGFSSPLIKISGIVVRKNGQTNAYIQQYDEETDKYYGIYVYGGYNAINKLILGASVEITAKIGYYYGSLQITDLISDQKIRVFSINNFDSISVIDENASELDIYDYYKIGNLIKLEGLTVQRYNDADNTSATTLYCKTADGEEFNIRIDQSVALYDPETGERIIGGAYFQGKTFKSIIGVLCYYNGNPDNNKYDEGKLQLALTDMADVVFE